MSRNESVRNCRTSSEFVRAVERQGGRVDNGGRHYKVRGPEGNGCVPVPRHPGDLPTGTRCSIIKALVSLGFMVLAIACVVSQLI